MRISSIWNASILLCILSFQNVAQISSFQYPTFSVVNDSFRVTRKKSHNVFLSSKRSVPVVPNNGAIFAKTRERYDNEIEEKQTEVPRVVLVTGFESFNRDLYNLAASELPEKIHIDVFADMDIRCNGGANVRKSLIMC